MRVRLTHVLLILVILAAAPTAFAGERAQQNDPRFSSRLDIGSPTTTSGSSSGARRHEDVRPPHLPRDDFKGSPSSSSSAGDADRPERRRDAQPARRGLLPYTTMNGSTFPAPDPALTKATPSPNDAEYTAKIIQFVKENAPDSWEGMPGQLRQDVLDHRLQTPSRTAARPACCRCSTCRSGVRRPRSRRATEEQRLRLPPLPAGIMHYDDGCKCTQGLLLGDYLKALITGENLPIDLEAQAQENPLLRQYQNSAGNGLARAAAAGSNFKDGSRRCRRDRGPRRHRRRRPGADPDAAARRRPGRREAVELGRRLDPAPSSKPSQSARNTAPPAAARSGRPAPSTG